MWNPGDARVEKYMGEVATAIKKHLGWPSEKFTEIYNRAYEAVWKAITDKDNTKSVDDVAYRKYWIEHFHSEFMKNFHAFRIEKSGEDVVNVNMDGSDLSKIIAATKLNIYARMGIEEGKKK